MAAAVLMGLAISGMHYTGMAATRFAAGSFCQGGVTLQNGWLGATVGVVAVGLLAMTLLTAVCDAHLKSAARTNALRLERANEELQHQATHDALTSLPNRVLLLDRLGREVVRGERGSLPFAVLVVDLDRFKVVNDTLGHGAGDQLLVEVARRLSMAVRAADTVARTGGDEFLLLLSGINEAADAGVVATKIVSELDKPISIGVRKFTHRRVLVSVCILRMEPMRIRSLPTPTRRCTSQSNAVAMDFNSLVPA